MKQNDDKYHAVLCTNWFGVTRMISVTCSQRGSANVIFTVAVKVWPNLINSSEKTAGLNEIKDTRF